MFFDELSTPFAVVLLVSSGFFLGAFTIALWRVAKGPTVFDRVLALDLSSGLCLSLLVLLAIRFDQPALLDAAFAIAVISFMGTVAFARYLGKGGGT